MPKLPSSRESRKTLQKAYLFCLVLLSLTSDIRCANFDTEMVDRRTVKDIEKVNLEKLEKRLINVTASVTTPKPPKLPLKKTNTTVAEKVVHISTTSKPNLPLDGSKLNTHIKETLAPGRTTSKPTTKPIHPVTISPIADVHVVTTSIPKHRTTIAVPSKGSSSRPPTVMSTTARPLASTTTEPPIGSYWDGWNRLKTVEFWKKRYNDHEYMLQLTLPIAIGIGAGALLAFLVSIVRCMYTVRRIRRRVKRNKTMHFDKEGSDKWMLLEKASSSDEEDTV